MASARWQSTSGKTSRSYRSTLREQQAEQTRTRVVATAAQLFAAEGYARTTFAKIAAAAGVSAETVQGQGPKAALMIAAIEYAAFGVSGEDNVFNLDVGRRMLAVDDYTAAADALAAMHAEMFKRIAHLVPIGSSSAALGSHYTSFGRTVPSGCSTVTTIEVVRQPVERNSATV